MKSISTGMRRFTGACVVVGVSMAMIGCGPQGPDATPPPARVATTVPDAPTTATPTAPMDAAPTAMVGQPMPAVPVGQPVPPAPGTYQGRPANDATPVYAPPVQAAQAQPAPQPERKVIVSSLRGKVSGIEPIRERPQGTGKGAVIGGVLGAVVGNQFGHGTGRAAMTVVGAAGGAVAGNNVERNINKRVIGYRVSVRLDNGKSRTFEETRLNDLRVGDRVRIEGGHLRRG